jgi:fatty acid-binding protein DegV
MVVGKKFRGNYERCLKQYVDDRLRSPDSVRTRRVFITYTGVDRERFELTKKMVLEHVPFEEVLEVRAGCSITSHCGQGTLGVLFIRK